MSSDLVAIENRLWIAAEQLRVNTGLKPAEFSTPVVGQYFMVAGFVYSLPIALRRTNEPPAVLGGASTVWGWLRGALQRMPRYDEPELFAGRPTI